MSEPGSDLRVGQVVPDYELLRRIGAGAYGEVWLARSKATGVLRAAKFVWRHKFDDDRPFQREFEGLQRFEQISREHPSQLSLFHIGRNDAEGYFYYVMELADNIGTASDYLPRTLRAEIAKGRLPAERVVHIGAGLAEALAYLHGKGLVHRDVKASNVIFVNANPKLADIGLVTDASDARSIVGTEGYLPPEGPGMPQADIFALGKVLYEAATGLDRRQFPKLPHDLRSWPDAKQVFELNEIIVKACATAPGARYADAKAMLGELEMLSRGKSVRRRRSLQWRWNVGKRAALALGAVVAIAALFFAWQRQLAPTEPSAYGLDSTNVEANALCEKAMLILRGDNYAEVGVAYTNFNRAIGLDPNFARPYVGLLEFGVREDVYIPGLPGYATTERLRSIEHHLGQLAPHLPARYLAQSAINWGNGDFPESERCILEAINANPNYEFSYTFYSWLLDCYARTDEALKQLEIAQRLAPSRVIVYRAFGNTYYVARDYPNAIAWYQKAINWEPHHSVAWDGVGTCLQAMGDYTNALGFFETNQVLRGVDETSARQRTALLRRAMDADGIHGYWIQQWQWAESKTNETLYRKAVIQIHLGNTNAALDLLEKSYETHERGAENALMLNLLLYDYHWVGLHNHPRFKALLEELGFTKVMRPRKS
jgi:serine/threonine protein kinase